MRKLLKLSYGSFLVKNILKSPGESTCTFRNQTGGQKSPLRACASTTIGASLKSPKSGHWPWPRSSHTALLVHWACSGLWVPGQISWDFSFSNWLCVSQCGLRESTDYFMANSEVKQERAQWGGLSTGRNFRKSQQPGRQVKAAQNSRDQDTRVEKSYLS